MQSAFGVDSASLFLSEYGRQRWNIQGDGNCLFRCLSLMLFGTQDRHFDVRTILVKFIALNPSYFSAYCHPSTVKCHVNRMANYSEWGTHTEIFAASLYLKHPIFVAVCKNSVQHEYYWAKYQCLPTPGNDVVFPDQSYGQLPQGIKHSVELCHVMDNHYDCVVLISDKSFSLIPPYIGDLSTSIAIC